MKQILAGRRVEYGIFLDDFDSHVAVKHFVVGAINDDHATFADLGGDAAMAENLADHVQTPFQFMLGCSSENRQRTRPSMERTSYRNIVDF